MDTPNIATPSIDAPVADTSIDTTLIPSTGIFDNPMPFTDVSVPDTNRQFDNPFTAGQPAAPTSNEDPLAGRLNAELRKPPSFEAQTAPEYFDWEKSNADRYTHSEYYKELGFNPNRDNETLFGHRQTWGDTLLNAFAGSGGLAWNTFIDGWKGWGRMVSALTNWDFSRLMGTPEELDELNKKQQEIMDKYAVFKPKDSENSIFNRHFFGDMMQQTGFALGTLGQFAAEELLTFGASTAFDAVKAVGTLGRIARGATTAEAALAIKRLGDTGWEAATATKLYKGLKFMGEHAPVVSGLFDTGLDLWKASKYGTDIWEVGGITLNGLRRTLAESNMAFTESRMEAAGTYGEMKAQLFDETFKNKGDVSVEDQQRIEQKAQAAAWSNFEMNAAVLSIMNRIEFDNLFQKFNSGKRVARELAEAGVGTAERAGKAVSAEAVEGAAEKINKVTGKAIRDVPGEGGTTAIKAGEPLTQVYEKGKLGTFGNLGKIAADFGKGQAAWEATKSLGRNLFKWEVLEGAQELIQEGSNTAIKDYYDDLYNSRKPDTGRSVDKAIDSLANMNGLKIFVMGAATGRLLAPVNRSLNFITDRVITNAAQRNQRKIETQKAIGDVNTYFRNPAKYNQEGILNLRKKTDIDKEDIDPSNGYSSAADSAEAASAFKLYNSDPSKYAPESVANLRVQDTAAKIMEQAVANNDQYVYEHAKDGAFAKAVSAAKKLNMLPSLVDTIRAYGDHFDDKQFYEAYGVDFDDKTSTPRKTVKQAMNRLADEVTAFSDRYDSLRETYTGIIKPERYKGKEKGINLLLRRAIDDAVEWGASSEYRAKRAAERRLSILETASQLPSVGKSAYKAFRILGDDAAMQREADLLKQEIATMEGSSVQDATSKQTLELKKIQYTALEKLRGNVDLFEKTKTVTVKDEEGNSNIVGATVDDEEGDSDVMDALRDYTNALNKESGIDERVTPIDLHNFHILLRDSRRLRNDSQRYMDVFGLLTKNKAIEQTVLRIRQGLEYVQQKQEEATVKNSATKEKEKAPAAASTEDQQEKDLITKAGADVDEYHGYRVNDKITYEKGSEEQGPFNIERISTTRVELFNSKTNVKEKMSLDRFDGLVQADKVKHVGREEVFNKTVGKGQKLIDGKGGVYILEITKKGVPHYVLMDSKKNLLNEKGGFENADKVKYEKQSLAEEARDKILSLRGEQEKEDKQVYTFDGKEIRKNDILIKDGQRYRVLTSKEPAIKDGKPVIDIQLLGSNDITTIDNLKDYEGAKEVAGARVKAKQATANKVKLKVSDVLFNVRGIVKDGESQEEADKRLQEFIRNTASEDFIKKDNVVIRVSRDPNWKKDQQVTHPENRNLQMKAGNLIVEVLYKGEPVGTIAYYTFYKYQDESGKVVELSDLTKDQFQQIFDVAVGDVTEGLTQVKENYKLAANVFTVFSREVDKHGTGTVDLNSNAIRRLFKLTLFSGDYDWSPKPSVPLKDLRYKGVGGKVVLVTRELEWEKGGLVRKEKIVTEDSTLTDKERGDLLKRIKKNSIQNGIDTTMGMGSYLGVVELPNKELRFVSLQTPVYDAKEMEEVIKEINERSKVTKETNVEEEGGKKKKLSVKEGDFNKDFNAMLAKKFVIGIRPGIEANFSLSATGDLEVVLLKDENSKSANATIRVTGKGVKGPLAFANFDELLKAINEKILEYNGKQSDAVQHIDFTLEAGHFRKLLDEQPDFAAVKNLITPVTEQVLSGGFMKVNYNTTPTDVLDVLLPQFTGFKNGEKKVEAGEITKKKVAEGTDRGEGTTNGPGAATGTGNPSGTNGTTGTGTTSGTGTTAPIVPNKPASTTPAAPTVPPTPRNKGGEKVDELKRLQAELPAIQARVYNKYEATGMAPKDILVAVEKDAEVVAHKATIKRLEDEINGEAKAYKVVTAKVLSESKGAVEDIERFKDWVKEKLPDFITADGADLIRQNMLKAGVTVGQFIYSLKTLSAARIEVDKDAPYKYHEAFHAVFRLLLSDMQIEDCLRFAKREVKDRLARKKTTLEEEVKAMRALTPEYYEGLSDTEMERRYYEEYLADRFDAWKMDPSIKTDPANKSFFRKILDWIQNLIGPYTSPELEGLFYKINAGEFKEASLAINKFTNSNLVNGNTEVVPKAIPIGKLLVKNEDGEAIEITQYLPEEKGSALASAIAATFVQRRERASNDVSMDELLNGIFEDYATLYDKDNEQYLRLLEDKDTREEYYRKAPELDKLKGVFTTGRDILREAVEKHFQSIEYLYEDVEDEEDDVVDERGDQAAQDYKKSAASFGGFGSLPKWLRQYIATTTYQAEDAYGNKYLKDGEPLLQAVDSNTVYSGILKAVAGFDDMRKMLLRMKEFARYNEQSARFIERFFSDMGIVLTDKGYDVLKDEMRHKFNMVMKGFQQYTPNYLSINKNLNNQRSYIINADRIAAAGHQFSIWYNAYSERFLHPYLQMADSKKIAFLNDSVSGLELFHSLANSKRITDAKLEKSALEISNQLKRKLGISLHPLYIQYSLACARTMENLTDSQQSLVETFGDVESMKRGDATLLLNSIRDGKNPFVLDIDMEGLGERIEQMENNESEQGDEIDSNRRLMSIARSNAICDETVNTTSFRNAKGELVYGHQLPTYHLARVKELSELLAKGAPVEEALGDLLNDPFMANHFLLKSDDFRKMVGDLRVSRIEGIRSKYEGSKYQGVTYGDFTAREMLVSLFELYGKNQRYEGPNGIFYSSQHLIRVIEATNTGDTVNLPIIKAVEDQFDFVDNRVVLSDTAIKIMTEEVRKEFDRIGRVQKEIKQLADEQYAFERDGTPRTLKEVDEYHNTRGAKDPSSAKPRGLTLFKTGGMLGKLAAELEAEAQVATPTFDNYKKRIGEQLQEHWMGKNGELDKMMKDLKDLGIIRESKNKDGRFENVLLPEFMAKGFTEFHTGDADEKRNDAMNLKGLAYNVAQVMVNDFINTLSFNQLLLGDQALSLKDYVDMVKRAKGANGSGPSIAFDIIAPLLGIHHSGRTSHILQIDDPVFKGLYAGKSVAKADAQMWMTVKSLRYTLFGLGQLTPRLASLLDKLEHGEKVNIEEIFGRNGTISYDGQTNSLKLVYYDGKRYIKTSGFLLTQELTSAKNLKEEWEPRKGWEELDTLRRKLEDYERRHDTICMAVPKSASKGEKANTARGIMSTMQVGEDGSMKEVSPISDWNFQQLDNRYWRLQTVNPSNKMIITDPTQAKQLIMAEQNDGLEVEFMWNKKGRPISSNMNVGDLKRLYREQTAQREKVKYRQARNELFDLEGTLEEIKDSINAGEVSPKLARFQQQAVETLRATGADSQLLEFFSLNANGKPNYDLNNPATLDKFTQLFLAYFSKDVMNEKIPGHAVTLVSSYGARVVKEVLELDDKGQPKRWRVVRRVEYEDNPGAYKDALEWEADPNEVYESEEERKKNASDHRVFHTLQERMEADRAAGKKTYIVDDLRHNVPVYKLDGNGKIMQDKDGNDIILERYTEYMMAPHSSEAMRLMNELGELPEVLAKGFGVRIPSQDKHSFVNLRLVDFLPGHYGSSAILAPELAEISGADFDVDKIYLSIKDHYTRKINGKTEFVEYGRTEDAKEQYDEYLRYQKRSNKQFKKRYKELLTAHPSYNELKEKALALRNVIKPFKEAANRRPSYYKNEHSAFWLKHSAAILIDEIFGVDMLGEQTTANLNDLMATLEEKPFLDELKKIEDSGEVNLKEWKSNYTYLSSVVKQVDDSITNQTLQEFSMPETVEDYERKVREEGEQNIGKLNNVILDVKMGLQGNESVVKWKNNEPPIAYQVASIEPLEDVVNYLKETFPVLEKSLEEGNIDPDSMRGKVVAYRNNKEGAQNIGPAVNSMLAYALMNTFKVKLREKNSEGKAIWCFRLNGVDFRTYENKRAYSGKDNEGRAVFEGERILHHISAIVSAMTDNAKERLAAKLGLNMEAVGLVSNLVAQGVPLKSAITFILQPIIQEYYKRTSNLRSALKTEEEEGVGSYAMGEQMKQELKDVLGANLKTVELTDELLKDNILNEKKDLNHQYSILQSFLNLKKQTSYFNTVSGVMKLVKGMGTSFEDSRDMQRKIEKLRLYEGDKVFNKSFVPFDVRQIMTGANKDEEHHEVMATYLDIFNEVSDLSKAMFLERTDFFDYTGNVTENNFRVKKHERKDFYKRFKKDHISYLEIAGYLKMLMDKGLVMRAFTLNNAMVHDADAVKLPKDFKDIVDVVKAIRERLPDNYFAHQFLNALPTTITLATGETVRNPYNMTGINKAEINTWAKLNQLQVEKLQDSFLDIYQSDDTRSYAWALFHYLLVKDGGQFRNGSFIRYIPNFMFKDLSEITSKVNELMAKKAPDERMYKELFGMGSKELRNKFIRDYLLNINNKRFITSIDLSVNKKESLPFGEDEEDETKQERIEDYKPAPFYFYEDGRLEIDLNKDIYGRKKVTGPVKVDEMLKNENEIYKKRSDIENARWGKNMQELKRRGFWEGEQTITKKKGAAKEVSAIRFPYVLFSPGKGYYVLTEVNGKKYENPTDFISEDEFVAAGSKAVYRPIEGLEGAEGQWAGGSVFGELAPPLEHLRERVPILNNGGFSLEERRKMVGTSSKVWEKEVASFTAYDVLYDFQDQYDVNVRYEAGKGLVFERNGKLVLNQEEMTKTYLEYAERYADRVEAEARVPDVDEYVEPETEKGVSERLDDEDDEVDDWEEDEDFSATITAETAEVDAMLQRMREGPLECEGNKL